MRILRKHIVPQVRTLMLVTLSFEMGAVLLQMAELYNSMNQFDKAAGTLQRMLALNPSNYELKRSTAQACVRAQKYDEALATYAQAKTAAGKRTRRANAKNFLSMISVSCQCFIFSKYFW